MNTITRVTRSMQKVLTKVANQSARETGFIKRERKLTGASFVQSLVFGWLGNGTASSGELNQAAAVVGVIISPWGLVKRFNQEAAECLKQVLEAAMQEVVGAGEEAAIPLLQRFKGVHILDSSTVGLPAALAKIWPGCGGSRGENAALKIQVELNFLTGALNRLWLQAGRQHDLSTEAQAPHLPAEALWITDLGYFKLAWFKALLEQGVFWLTRLKMGTNIYTETGQKLNLGRWLGAQKANRIDLPILLGSTFRLPCRLLAVRVPEAVAARRRRKLKRDAQKKGQMVSQARLALADWTLLVTSVPVSLLSLEEALILYRVRWQIELLFKLWKNEGELDTSRSQNPWRILCEVYAKLLAMIIQHWIFLTEFWSYPNRSLTKASQTVRKFAFSLALAFQQSSQAMAAIFQAINRCLAAGCRIDPRRSQPSTYQLLESVLS